MTPNTTIFFFPSLYQPRRLPKKKRIPHLNSHSAATDERVSSAAFASASNAGAATAASGAARLLSLRRPRGAPPPPPFLPSRLPQQQQQQPARRRRGGALSPPNALPPPPSSGDASLLASEDSPPAAPASWFQARRTWIVLMCFVAFCACNLDRVNMAVAIMPMSVQYGWDSRTVGLVQSSFFWGYLLTQVAGGVWADRYGGKKVLGFGVVWWSLATMLTPLAAQLGLPVLLAARAAMGVGEGVAMPAMNNLLSRWVPVQERSRSLALVYSGMYSGSVLGLALSPHMIHALQWPSVFYVFGALGVVWWLVWESGAASNPSEDPLCTEEEKAYISASTPPSAAPASIPWKKLLTRAPVWALIVSHFCHNWGTFILLTWMPTYYNQVLGEF